MCRACLILMASSFRRWCEMAADYDVIACYARRRQKEAAANELAAKYPDGYWWLTGECHHEFRVPVNQIKEANQS